MKRPEDTIVADEPLFDYEVVEESESEADE